MIIWSFSGIALGLLLIIGIFGLVEFQTEGGKQMPKVLLFFSFIPIVYVILAAFKVEFFYGITKAVMVGDPIFLIPSLAQNNPKQKRKMFYILKYAICVFVLLSLIIGGLNQVVWIVVDWIYVCITIALLI